MLATPTKFASIQIAFRLSAALWLGLSTRASAEEPAPADLMHLLSEAGLHDVRDERWNAYGQLTYISVFKLPWKAPYSNVNGSPNSFSTGYERSFTETASLFFGVKLWSGGELYAEPDLIGERALSELHGLGSVTENFELQKTGGEAPNVYRARLFGRQTIGLGGEDIAVPSSILQLGTIVKSRRLVVTLGNVSVIDIFTRNNVTGDPRHTFFNEAFMTDSAFDFAADARGYTFGAAAELYWDAWVLRFGRFAPPKAPNQQTLDLRLWTRYDDTLEVEHDHSIAGHPGAVRLLVYRNQVFSGRFDDAIRAYEQDPSKSAANCPADTLSYGSTNASAPDFCWVRKMNIKRGIGLNLDQYVSEQVGLFLRTMINDGASEVDAYDSAEFDLSAGGTVKGGLWSRPDDLFGAGFQLGMISDIHARYLELGGIDAFIGDGQLHTAPEMLIDIFYSLKVFRNVLVAADYQLLFNPGYNADRSGPIHMPGFKIHAEF